MTDVSYALPLTNNTTAMPLAISASLPATGNKFLSCLWFHRYGLYPLHRWKKLKCFKHYNLTVGVTVSL